METEELAIEPFAEMGCISLLIVRSYSPAPRRRGDYSVSPVKRQASRSRSPGGDPPQGRNPDNTRRRSYTPGYSDADGNDAGNGYER